MKAIGVIVEYNPFHNGHLYHLNKVKEMYPSHIVIAIMSGNFVQRGDVSILSKWDKTEIAINYGVDIVLDLPFVYANESADFFAASSLKILNHFNVSHILFGSECGDKSLYYKYAKIQLENNEYNEYVKEFLNQGKNYPSACSLALKKITGEEVNLPNDILGLAYTKAIINNNYNIEVDVITRTNSYHSLELEEVSSATSIRNAIENSDNFDIAVPSYTNEKLKDSKLYFTDELFELIKYKITVSTAEQLSLIHLVDEGIENRLKAIIASCNCFDQLVKQVSSKRYTYSRVSRMLFNILMNYTKQERMEIESCSYNRVLGFSKDGQDYLKYLNSLEIDYDISIKNIDNTISDVEYRCSAVINLIDKDYIENNKIKRKES